MPTGGMLNSVASQIMHCHGSGLTRIEEDDLPEDSIPVDAANDRTIVFSRLVLKGNRRASSTTGVTHPKRAIRPFTVVKQTERATDPDRASTFVRRPLRNVRGDQVVFVSM